MVCRLLATTWQAVLLPRRSSRSLKAPKTRVSEIKSAAAPRFGGIREVNRCYASRPLQFALLPAATDTLTAGRASRFISTPSAPACGGSATSHLPLPPLLHIALVVQRSHPPPALPLPITTTRPPPPSLAPVASLDVTDATKNSPRQSNLSLLCRQVRRYPSRSFFVSSRILSRTESGILYTFA
jgi:hypothetical protein